MTGIPAIDLFAGGGGWDLAARSLGVEPLGIELDDAACATREAAGFRTLQADVAALDPLDFGPCELIAASAPCQSFSRAGKREGLADLPLVYEAAQMVADGTFAPGSLRWRDVRSELVVEPLRWALALKPRWIAWEQVPDVLPFWEFCAEILRKRGWNVWTGVLYSERFGVAQTRERAILMADRKAQVKPPDPTHQRYIKPTKESEEPRLFDAPREVERLVHPEDADLLPWVSMADALGWDQEIERPSPTVTAGGTAGGGVEVFGSQGRAAIAAATRLNTDRKTGDLPPEGRSGAPDYTRGVDQPSPVVDGRSRRWSWEETRLRNGNQENATERDAGEPSATLAFGHNAARFEWVYDRRQSSGDGTPVEPRPADEPAPTLTSQGLAKGRDVWDRPAPTIVTTRRSDKGILIGRQLPDGEGRNVGGRNWGGGGPTPHERPATTVAGDPRLSSPTHHNEGEQNAHAIRVSLEEAAVLQSFPADFPFQGSKSARFTAVGNAIPPLLARAILAALLQSR